MRVYSIILFSTIICFSSCRSTKEIPIVKNDIINNLLPGARVGAGQALLAHYGKKHKSNGYFDRFGELKIKSVQVLEKSKTEINDSTWSALKKIGVNYNEDSLINMKIGGKKNIGDNYNLIIYEINEQFEVREKINKLIRNNEEEVFINDLRSKNTRYVSSIGKIIGHQQNISLKNNPSFNFNIQKGSFNYNDNYGREATIKLGDSTIVIYTLHMFCWDTSGFVATMIKDLEQNEKCPDGTYNQFPHPKKKN